ncbi:hypothetical protein BHM03_00024605, partial [Ensete ventricosum]
MGPVLVPTICRYTSEGITLRLEVDDMTFARAMNKYEEPPWRILNCVRSKVYNFDLYRPIRAVHTDLPGYCPPVVAARGRGRFFSRARRQIEATSA